MSVTINGSNTPTAGGVTYGDGTNYATTAAGTSGQVLTSAGSGAPTWTAQSALSVGSATTATTATSATSATTATNLAGGGAGQVPYQSTAGATAFLAAGSAGQLLQSNGTSAPSWVAAPAGGSWIYLNTLTASSSSDLIYSSFSSTYDVYVAVLSCLLPANNGVILRCNPYSVANGEETNNYNASYGRNGAGTATGSGGTTTGNTNIAESVGATAFDASRQGVSGIVYFANPRASSKWMQYWYHTVFTSDSSFAGYYTGGARSARSGVADGFRISFNSGTITSGTVRIYGIKNS